MNKITVSAPGKLMLLSEHAVVYQRPCIVTAVNQRMKATVELLNEPIFQLNAPDVQVANYQKSLDQLGQGDIPKGARFIEVAVKNFALKSGVKVTTCSEFSSLFGFGSSSASTVCVIKALSELTDANLDNKAIFDLAYKTVLDIQGKGSGFDVAAAVFGGTLFYQVKQSPSEVRGLYFVTGGKVIDVDCNSRPTRIIEPLNIPPLPLIVGYSGIKADTVILINQVLEKSKENPQATEDIYNNIAKLVEQAKVALLNTDWTMIGQLMDQNQALLKQLGVSIDKLDNMISAARKAGAYGAKLSGAGGGDCMIALAPEDKIEAVKKAITQAGGQMIEVETNVEGVRIEP